MLFMVSTVQCLFGVGWRCTVPIPVLPETMIGNRLNVHQSGVEICTICQLFSFELNKVFASCHVMTSFNHGLNFSQHARTEHQG